MSALAHAADARRGAVPATRVPTLLLGATVLASVAGVGLFGVMQTSRAATAGYEIRALERERDLLGAENRLLEADVASMTQMSRIRQEAVTRLGMTHPKQTLRVSVGVTAPRVMPLPERYVRTPEAVSAPALAWWESLLRHIPGFD